MRPTSVLIVEPNQLFREGLRQLLRKHRFQVVADTRSLEEALSLPLETAKPAIVVLGSGWENDTEAQVASVRERYSGPPRARIVVLADIGNAALLRRVAVAGVDAVLSRDISSEVLQRSLELVVLGQQLFPASLAHAPAEAVLGRAELIPFPLVGSSPAATRLGQCKPLLAAAPAPASRQREVTLSEREGQILGCLVNGASNKAIARELQISEATVKVHVKGLLRKVRANNRTQAAIWALSNGGAMSGAIVQDLSSVPDHRATA